MRKIILYYKFAPVTDPQMTMRWQRELCMRLNLLGRVIISEHGINGTLGGELDEIKTYIKQMNLTPEFKGIDYKWSEGPHDGRKDFPRLSIKVRKELVTLEPDATSEDSDLSKDFDVFDTGIPLKPAAWHAYLEKHPDAIIFDARNEYESDVGKFKNAITPKIKTFKDVKSELEKLPKDQPVLTYCTGDIRCEYLSAYMKHTGFQEVYHLDGGIVKYGQQFGDGGFWEGKCYVFDSRLSIAFSDDSTDVGVCVHCQAKTSSQANCVDDSCNLQFVVCESCATAAKVSCDRH